MAGTDTSQTARLGGPTIILIEPQLGDNIGAAARAMLNCGLTELRLVRPRDGWPSHLAERAASGAIEVIENTQLFDETSDAIADLEHVWASSARPRDMVKPVLGPRAAARDMRAAMAENRRCGILFGPERTGLVNEDIVLADAIIEVPLNPAFSSLNIAQAVLLIAWEWHAAPEGAAAEASDRRIVMGGTQPATKEEILNLFRRLEAALDASGFLGLPEKRPSMVQSIRNMLQRAALTQQEARTFHGIISALTSRRADIGED